MAGRTHSFEVNRTSSASAGTLFRLARKVGCWPILMREKTVEYEQDRRHVYELIQAAHSCQGLPCRSDLHTQRGRGHRHPLGRLVHRRAARDGSDHARNHGRIDQTHLGPAGQSGGA
jgi:hypothetical protein